MDVVTLGAALNGSKKYTDQVTQSLMGGVHYRGSVSYYTDLPNDPREGDSYTVKYAGTSGSVEDGTEYTWGYDTDSQAYAWISFSKDAYSKAETDALLSGKQAALSQTQLNAVNSGIDSEKVEQIATNKNNILMVLDANGKKQLIPNFGVLTSDNITYTQNGTSITVVGSKNSGEANYVNIINAPYEYFGLKANDKIVVINSDAAPVYVGIGFDNGGYTVNARLVIGTQELTLPTDRTHMFIRIGLLDSTTTISKTIQPLVCNKKLYDISQTISQYAMSNAELTAAIKQLENRVAALENQ